MKEPTLISVKTGSASEFMDRVKQVMRSADKGEALKPSHTVMFEDPKELLHFLSESKLKLIAVIRNHPDSITNLAKAIHRDRSAVGRDIQELEKFGLVKVHQEVNPGHGHHKIVELVASRLKLEAYL